MIVTAVVCPHPPLLFRELSGQQDAAVDLRKACHRAVAALEDADVVVAVGGADTAGEWPTEEPFDVTRFGMPGARRSPRSDLPLSLGVAGRLLDEVGWVGPRELVSVGWDASATDLAATADRVASRSERIGLLVMAEGSARRGQSAPGYVDVRAPAFDAELGRALAEPDPAALAGLDLGLAGELMVLGRSSFRVLGRAVSGARSTIIYEDDPFGVMYFVAVWDTLDG